MQVSPFKQLQQCAEQFIPGLQEELPGSSSDLRLDTQNGTACCQKLYHYWQQQQPQAGRGYWQARSWTLLCWQPISLALVGVYGCASIPQQLHQIEQYWRQESGLLLGYYLPDRCCIKEDKDSLIHIAGDQLRQFWQPLFQHSIAILNLSRRRAERLLAEQLLELLLRLNQRQGGFTLQQLQQQGQLWLQAMALPESISQQLNYGPDRTTIQLYRRSCCLLYRCPGETFCSNCPKFLAPKTVIKPTSGSN